MKLTLLVFLFPFILCSQSNLFEKKQDQIANELQILREVEVHIKSDHDKISKEFSLYLSNLLQSNNMSKNNQIEFFRTSSEKGYKYIGDLLNFIESYLEKQKLVYSLTDEMFNDLINKNKIFQEKLNQKQEALDSLIQAKDEKIRNLQNELDDLKSFVESSQIELESLKEDNGIVETFDSGSFLTNLYQGDEKINNQTFNLRFEGVLNYEIGGVKLLDNFGDLDTENMFNFSRLILVKDLFLKVHSPINKKSSWKENCNCPINPTIYKKNNYLDGVLPNLSFFKGKLVTISNDYKKQNFSTDFLFSEVEFDKENREYEEKRSYLYDFKYFSFTKEGESLSETRSIIVPLVVIHGRVFLLLNNSLISNLDLGFKFYNDLGCNEADGSWSGLTKEELFLEYRTKNVNNSVWRPCNSFSRCKRMIDREDVETRCNRPMLIEIFKKPDAFSSEEKMYIDDKDYFLFELVEQE